MDGQLAPFAHKIGPARIRTTVAAAIVKFDPDRAAEAARRAEDRRGVWVGDVGTDGTCGISITADAVDALSFDQAIAAVAACLGRLGDDSELQARRAAAVGVLADPQAALDLLTDPAEDRTDPTGATRATRRLRRRPGARVVLYAHLSVDALHGLRKHGDDCGCRCPGAQAAGQAVSESVSESGVRVGPAARLEGLGPVTTDQVAAWLGRDLTGPQVVIRPVLDLAESRPVDAYEAPGWMDEVIYLRQPCCIFPWCTNRSRRKDSEHPVPYDPDGPPDQTQPDKLGHVCRRHHRLKTYGGWSYTICEPGIYLWRSPHGQRYLVDGTGTRNLTDPSQPEPTDPGPTD